MLFDTKTETKTAKADVVDQDSKFVKFETSQTAQINNIKDLVGEFPDPNGVYFLWTKKSFNAFTFIVYVLKYKAYIEELTFSTYGINIRIITSLFKRIDDNKIGQVNIFMAESATYRIPKVLDHLKSMCDARPGKVNVFYGWNHSKITLMKTADSFFTVAGSGNFSENARHEQYVFADNPSIYNFYKNCIMSNE